MVAKKTTTKKTKEKIVTKADLEVNPNLIEEGVQAGDVIEVVTKKKGKVERVVFTLSNKTIREFSEEFHGKDFVNVANEFAETNKAIILARVEI